MKKSHLKFLSLGLAVSGFACASQAWKVAKFDEFDMCLDPTVEWKESRIGGIFGSHLEYVTGTFPYTTVGDESGIIYITLRPVAVNDRSEGETTELLKANFDESLGLYLYELNEGTEVVFASSESEIGLSASPEKFKATCREALHRYCARSFQYDSIEGSYSFARESLEDWRKWEAGLAQFLQENLAKRCSKTAK